MKIGIDIRSFGYLNDKAGIFQYIHNLISNLLRIDFLNDYILFSTIKGMRNQPPLPECAIRKFPGRVSAPLLERLPLPIELFMGNIDLFHGPDFFVPATVRCKNIMTIHDLMVFTRPDFLKPEWVISKRKRILTSIKRADLIIAVSHFTKDSIVHQLNVPEEKVRVVYNGISSIYRPAHDHISYEKVKGRYGLDKPYILYVGNMEPKKNLERLIQAYSLLRETYALDYSLLIVGKKSWYFQKIWCLVKELKMENNIIFTDVVDETELPDIYRGAQLFTFPSLYEGFGIPVLEAMACGVPVVTSDRASIPEIAQGAALLINPLNTQEMAEGIYKLLISPSLKNDFVKKGLQRAKGFSWEKTAQETLSVYLEAMG